MKVISLKTCALLGMLPLASCMTTYDAYGRPVQTVDPAATAVGVLAAGAVGYAIGRNNDNHYYYGGHYGGHYHCY